MLNYYKLLGVGPKAEGAEIKAAYRRLALREHPDRNAQSPEAEKEAAERFKLLLEAYKTLSDPHRRLEYTRELADYVRARRRFLCDYCGTINVVRGPLAAGKTAACGSCNEALPLSEKDREDINLRAPKPRHKRVLERIGAEARSVAGEMALAAVDAALRRYARKLR